MNKNGEFDIDLLFGDFKLPKMDSSKKFPLCLVLDKSGSMAGRTKSPTGSVVKIDELNTIVEKLLVFIKNDVRAAQISDICIIGFGGRVEVVSGYSKVEQIKYNRLKPDGGTPLGEAIELAMGLLEKRRHYYRENSIEHYKPVMMVLSDGEPTDNYQLVADKCAKMVRNKEIKVYPVGIGSDFKMDALKQFSPIFPPKRITDVSGFLKLFELLSSSTSNPEDDSLDKWFMEQL